MDSVKTRRTKLAKEGMMRIGNLVMDIKTRATLYGWTLECDEKLVVLADAALTLVRNIQEVKDEPPEIS